ncbi:MAG: WhiB family transcriptional regulator [Nocardioidaceae bacterium]|nr:WhiB family transcriptional regulator [Nocardioidaceae bacterium]
MAKELCAACPLQRACLREALVEDEEWGIWGGLNPQERVALKERLNPPGQISWKVSAA